MNCQQKVPQVVIDIFKQKEPEHFYGPEAIDYYAWPQTFGDTSGPIGGIGGQAMSTFTVNAYVLNGSGPTLYVCAGMCYYEDMPFEFMKRIPHWKKLPHTETNNG
jgi:hypothetical protein